MGRDSYAIDFIGSWDGSSNEKIRAGRLIRESFSHKS